MPNSIRNRTITFGDLMAALEKTLAEVTSR
jgi:hypothetical protein